MAILGIDEVGRGPLAGPLVVGAVILPEDRDGKKPEWVNELKDSKKLTAKKREVLSEIILKESAAWGLGWVPAHELDEMGISAALSLATRRAVKSVQKLHAPFSQIVIDGKVNFLKDTALSDFVSTMPKADNLVKEVSAASIIAKVARDKYMYELDSKYPGYGFSSHVGYGTAKHMAAISALGITPEHRKSFEPIKSMVGLERPGANGRSGSVSVVKNTTLVGARGEEAACKYLVSCGHEIVVRNFKTRMCEIDIVSLCGSDLYFTEVKTRGSEDFGGGFGAIDKKKLEKMKFAVEVFLKARPEYKKYNPLLAAASVDGNCQVLDWVIIR
ncbi:ribonuclease HII [Candidatus Saccharibacteria bacterium]|nr:ribonuclease HII [Candidatus Saccharibacteria bacterium]